MRQKLVGLLSVLSAVFIAAAASSQSSAFDRDQDRLERWHVLDRHNYSSQIRIHPKILLLVSVPWSGESRSLMREIADLVAGKPDEFGSLELMYLQRNKEKMLADAIGAVEGRVTVFYLHHSVPYKYQGRLRAGNVLRSIRPYLLPDPEEIPITELKTEDELRTFAGSTDKAVLLMEFCGWTRKLLAGGNKNETTRSGLRLQGDFAGANGESEKLPISLGKENQKVAGEEKAALTCGSESAFTGIPSIGEFSSGNDSLTHQEDEYWDAENARSGTGLTCTYEQFQKFDAFFSKFMAVAREYFLPLEKHRFGLVSERSLLSSLGIGDSGSWVVMLSYNGCQSCSRILRDNDDLASILQSEKCIVTELEGNGEDVDPALPTNKPSVLLFVDRLSDSSEIRRKSREALQQFRDLSFHIKVSDNMSYQTNERSERLSNRGLQKLHVPSSGHPALKLSPTVQKMKRREKMSIMVLNDANHGSLENLQVDLQGKSLQEIIKYVLQQKKEATLSSVAKEAGFQLLSQDLSIKTADSLPSEGQADANQDSSKSSQDSPIRTLINLNEVSVLSNEEPSSDAEHSHFEENPAYLFTSDKPIRLDRLVSDVGMSAQEGIKLEGDEVSAFSIEETSSDVESSHGEERPTYLLTSEQPTKLDQLVSDVGISELKGIKLEEEQSLNLDSLAEEQQEVENFPGSFSFSDGNYRLLEALTGETRIPSLVIIDPVSHQHYVLPGNIDFSYASAESFVNRFLNGSLFPFQLSESEPASPREGSHPPFVNQNFHEVDSIPRVTVHRFHEMVIGFNQSDGENAVGASWNEDVLVLFSNNWCGFCQRMNLVVREVFRGIKGCMNVLKMGSTAKDTILSDTSETKFPKVFLMDCTLNDCSLTLRSVGMRDVYPTLLLFPAKSKVAVPYEGDATVNDIIEFIVNHGSNSEHLTSETGILRSAARKGRKVQQSGKDSSATTKLHDKDAYVESQEVILKHQAPEEAAAYSETESHTSRHSSNSAPPHVVIGTILSATSKITSQPFDDSRVIIVAADEGAGYFQGLMYNKPLRWEAVPSLEEGLKEVLKQAPLSFGGPLVRSGLPFVALTRAGGPRDGHPHWPEVAPGVYFLDQQSTVEEIEAIRSGDREVSDYWFFLGFSSWSWEQLFNEIAVGSWDVHEKGIEHLDWLS
ncbi:unnamed protein product [Linum tenue]|uniref:Thioredoxin domain-containing protein n=1 Tax=Linum tenue TaxID=586396 RepID=A0AAV0GYG4_9ROSI|nr:unnamed protein product [Linum tenue]